MLLALLTGGSAPRSGTIPNLTFLEYVKEPHQVVQNRHVPTHHINQ